jgi:diaminohydroxyphosphoribosylaminopyrimidine deaminase/5-amino-6-(5-phosphoribosylamino)uracil reductase
MKLALELANLGTGHVNPNPLVGAVVVKDDKIIGQGYHKFYGGPHAEVYALNQAGAEAEGATLYVTLEPCSHFGKTPPCVEKIIAAKIKRCIVGILDPNPLVSGRGVQILKDAGIEVVVGVLREECYNINRVFFKYIETKLPYLFLKCGITLDGKLATRSFSSKWITNSQAREKVQAYRNKFTGIMIGFTTALQDNPSLTCHLPDGRNPYRLVFDPELALPLAYNIISKNEDEKTILITKKSNIGNEKYTLLKECFNVKFIEIEEYPFSILEVMKKIGEMGIDSVLVEGGGSLISAIFKKNLFDGGEIFVAPKILGDSEAVPFISGFSPTNISDGISLPSSKINLYGDNVGFEFYKEVESSCLLDS